MDQSETGSVGILLLRFTGPPVLHKPHRARFRQMLRSCPKRAHRYLFESAENHKLDGIRLSTGEVSTEPEDVIQA
eukprot:3821275-Pyramimonas_sp.AAC.1